MAARILLAIALIVIGSGLDVPIAIVLGLVTLLVEVVHAVWARAGVRDVRYTRRLEARRAAFGDEIPMQIEVWNRQRLPLPWLRADDEASTGVNVRERDLAEGAEPGTEVLRNAWTLRPWERVVRRFHVGADRRGVFRIGPVDLSVGDPFARQAAADLRPRRRHVPRLAADGPHHRDRAARPLGRPRPRPDGPRRGPVAVRRRPALRRRATRSAGSTRGRAPGSAGR